MPSNAVSQVLERLKARQSGQNWIAPCPAHDDHTPSLSIAEGDDGRVLLTCHAGCQLDSIVSALGLVISDLFESHRSSKRGEVLDTYVYIDEEGNPLFRVVRCFPKQFYQQSHTSDGTWKNGLNGAEKVLYRLPDLLVRPEDTPVYIVEGEKDADRMVESGLTATTCPGGASKWRSEYSETLRGADVIIVPDNDDAGRRHAEQVASSLSGIASKIRVLELPGLAEHGDVSDWFDSGGTPADLMRLAESSSAWTPSTEDRPYCSLAVLMANPDLIRPPEEILSKLAWRGRATLLAAREKLGKTTYVAHAAACLTTGRQFLEIALLPGKVLWVGIDEATEDIARRFQDLQADPQRTYLFYQRPEPELILETIRDGIAELSPDLVVVDTLAHLARGLVDDFNAAAPMGGLVDQLVQLVRGTEAALVLLHHGKKSDGGYRDSTAIAAGVDVVLTMKAVEGDDRARDIDAVGRWSLAPFRVRLGEDGYRIGEPEPAIAVRIQEYLRSHPDSSTTAIRDYIGGRAGIVSQAVEDLVDRRLVIDNGTSSWHKYSLAPSEPGLASDSVPDRSESGTGELQNNLSDGSGTGMGQDVGQAAPVPLPHPIGVEGTGSSELGQTTTPRPPPPVAPVSSEVDGRSDCDNSSDNDAQVTAMFEDPPAGDARGHTE